MTDSQVLLGILERANPGMWMKRSQISQASREFLGLPLDVRTVSDIAAGLKGQVLGCGSGYMLASRATEKQVLESYGCIMRKALGSYRRANQIIANARARGLLLDAGIVRAERHKIVKEIGVEADLGRHEKTANAKVQKYEQESFL